MAKVTAAEREQTKKDIIAASEAVFREHGFQKTQIKMIAEKAGVGVSTIYGYYPSKIDLFLSSFLQLRNEDVFDEAFVEKHLEEGLIKGLGYLILEARFTDLLEDRSLLRTFYVASISDLAKSEKRKKDLRSTMLSPAYVKFILEIYERSHIRLCAFSLNALAETVMTIIQTAGVDYLIFDDLTFEDAKRRVHDQLRVLFAGKYENI